MRPLLPALILGLGLASSPAWADPGGGVPVDVVGQVLAACSIASTIVGVVAKKAWDTFQAKRGGGTDEASFAKAAKALEDAGKVFALVEDKLPEIHEVVAARDKATDGRRLWVELAAIRTSIDNCKASLDTVAEGLKLLSHTLAKRKTDNDRS